MSVEIVQGEDKILNIKLKDGNGADYDLTGWTLISVILKQSGGDITLTTASEVAVSGSALCGNLTVTVSDVNSLLLLAGDNGLEVMIDKGADRKIVQVKKAFKVLARL